MKRQRLFGGGDTKKHPSVTTTLPGAAVPSWLAATASRAERGPKASRGVWPGAENRTPVVHNGAPAKPYYLSQNGYGLLLLLLLLLLRFTTNDLLLTTYLVLPSI